jgi:putative transposase
MNIRLRDEKDFKIRFDYIHFNPVKHKLVSKVNDWEYSSFHKYVKLCLYDSLWCDFDENLEFE